MKIYRELDMYVNFPSDFSSSVCLEKVYHIAGSILLCYKIFSSSPHLMSPSRPMFRARKGTFVMMGVKFFSDQTLSNQPHHQGLKQFMVPINGICVIVNALEFGMAAPLI